jgi:hypothetical protein
VIGGLTNAKLSRWSIKYYNDTANAVDQALKDARKAGGGLGEYYTGSKNRQFLAPARSCSSYSPYDPTATFAAVTSSKPSSSTQIKRKRCITTIFTQMNRRQE